MKQNKITRSARGQDCQIRIPGVCNFDPETTVLCHVPGGGAGMKSADIHGTYGCSSCHDAVDGRSRTSYSRSDLKLMLLEGVLRTQLILEELGLLSWRAK